jgi:hypothetical protein
MALTIPSSSTLSWRDHAACAGSPPWWWFRTDTDGRDYPPEAYLLCRRVCAWQRECLTHALSAPESIGLWGGEAETVRRRLRGLWTERGGTPEALDELVQGRIERHAKWWEEGRHGR